MRLTADVILHAPAGINPCDERELDLRGYKIPMIENLGVTQDQFDAIDFSDNEIKKLDNFPRYKRLSSLLLCNNHVSRIAADLGTQLPNLSCLILTNNKLSTLADLEGLRTCKKLVILSLLHNEVVNKQYYRLYVINLVPSLKQLDFQKVTLKEREAAGRLAKSQAGQAMRQDVAQEAEKSKTFTPGKPAAAEQKLTDEHRAIYAERIAKATTVEEVEMLSRKIQAGIIPSATYKQAGTGAGDVPNGSTPPAVVAASEVAPPSGQGEADGRSGEGDAGVRSEENRRSGPVLEEKTTEESVAPSTKTVEAAAEKEVATVAAGGREGETGAETDAAKPSSASADGGEIVDGDADDEEVLKDALGDGVGAGADDNEDEVLKDALGDGVGAGADGDEDEVLKDAPAPAPTPTPAPAGPVPAATPHGTSGTEEAKMEAEAEAKASGTPEERTEAGEEAVPVPDAEAGGALPTTSGMDVEEGHGEAEREAEAVTADTAEARTTAAAGNGNGDVQEVAPEGGGDGSGAGADDAMVVENGAGGEREEQEAATVDAQAGTQASGNATQDGGHDGKETIEAADGAGDIEEEEDEGGTRDMEEEEDGGEEEPKLSEAQIKKLKVIELKKELVELELPTNGLKAELQARLLAAMGY